MSHTNKRIFINTMGENSTERIEEDRPKSEDKRFLLRLPIGLRMRIERSAREKRRTITQEILEALESYYPEPNVAEEIYNNLPYYIDLYRSGEAGSFKEDIIKVLQTLGIKPDSLEPLPRDEK